MIRSPACLAALALLLVPAEPEEPLSYEQAIRDIVREEGDGQWETALEAARALLEEADARELSEYRRAEVHYAIGVTLARRAGIEEPDERREALAPFESARALAGPGALRLDAGYDLGVVELLRAEDHRARIPELGGAQNPAAMAPPGPGEEPPPDPLELARAAYLSAKERSIERLRADWRDEDTRANLELIQRRLRELDEIERQREQQQSEQDPQPSEGEEGQEGEPSEDPSDPSDESESDSESSEQPPEGEGEESQQDPTGEGEQETDPIETGAQEEPPVAPESAAPPAERRLTREEAMRLLEALAEIEERGEELQKLLRESRRAHVERDW